MKNLKFLPTMLSIVFAIACFHVSVSGQSAEDKNKLATFTASGLSIRWSVAVPHAGLVLTVAAPDGQVFRKEFRASASPEFTLTDKEGNRLPDGEYNYELRLTPVLSSAIKKELAEGRNKGSDDDAAVERQMRKRGQLPSQSLVQSGSFTILNGSVIPPGATEPRAQRPSAKSEMPLRRRSTARPFVQSESFSMQEATFTSARAVEAAIEPFAHPALPDQVIPDDLIVQGSLCVGLDCVNNENFGFDTIRLKENNLRIKFEDTSVSPFPTNDWQLTANDSASGGQSKFSIDDVTGARTPFTVEAGATTNSIYVDSTGRVGFRTSTPVLDLHVNTSNTPALRLEQNSSGGFTAQTWDVAGNEANFFVRDVTSGSRLPFRIRPGAPTSSIDISASGNVGIGTASPASILTVQTTGADMAGETFLRVRNTNSFAGVLLDPNQASDADWAILGGFPSAGDFTIREFGVGNYLTIKKTTGRVGLGTPAPDQTLSVIGDASKSVGGTSWQVFSDERLKNIKGKFTSGLKALMQLQPLRYEYKPDNALGLKSPTEQVGFGAQALQKVLPEAVTSNEKGYLMVNSDPILWTMLNAIKEQQKEIEQLKAQIRQLQPRAGAGKRARQRARR